MALSDDQWAVAQAWVGTSEPRAAFESRFARLGDKLDDAIEERLISLITAATSNPASISLPSGLSISQGENIRSWQQVLKMFQQRGGTDGKADAVGTKVYKRSRPDVR